MTLNIFQVFNFWLQYKFANVSQLCEISLQSFRSLGMYFVLDLTGQLESSPKGYNNKALINVSALIACTVVSEQRVNISPRPPEPRRLPRSRSSLHSRRRRRRSRCALKE